MGVDERDPLRPMLLGVPHRPRGPKGYSSQLRDAIDMCVPDFDAPE